MDVKHHVYFTYFKTIQTDVEPIACEISLALVCVVVFNVVVVVVVVVGEVLLYVHRNNKAY